MTIELQTEPTTIRQTEKQRLMPHRGSTAILNAKSQFVPQTISTLHYRNVRVLPQFVSRTKIFFGTISIKPKRLFVGYVIHHRILIQR